MIVFNSLKAKINVSLILFDGFDFKMRKKKKENSRWSPEFGKGRLDFFLFRDDVSDEK